MGCLGDSVTAPLPSRLCKVHLIPSRDREGVVNDMTETAHYSVTSFRIIPVSVAIHKLFSSGPAIMAACATAR